MNQEITRKLRERTQVWTKDCTAVAGLTYPFDLLHSLHSFFFLFLLSLTFRFFLLLLLLVSFAHYTAAHRHGPGAVNARPGRTRRPRSPDRSAGRWPYDVAAGRAVIYHAYIIHILSDCNAPFFPFILYRMV